MCGVCGATLTKTKHTIRKYAQRHKNVGIYKCSDCGKDAGSDFPFTHFKLLTCNEITHIYIYSIRAVRQL